MQPYQATGRRVSPHFTDKELACKCCGQVIVNPLLVRLLERVRAALGKPILISSAYRCEKNNKAVGGVKDSQHLYGAAADIIIHGVKPYQVATHAQAQGADGIGIYDTFTHIDVRGPASRWSGKG